MKKAAVLYSALSLGLILSHSSVAQEQAVNANPDQKFNNPIIKHKFTADPAAIVHQDSVYL